mmetsp:Transcript_2384/g.3646  ORF Transcript_2384/g.3646 Transcript_2384/m.3646 type:complete len:201 (-) Transcript_2384:870-1472(-)
MPKQTFQVVNLKAYKKAMKEVYDRDFEVPEPSQEDSDEMVAREQETRLAEDRMYKAMGAETFFFSAFLPCHYNACSSHPDYQTISGNKIDVAVAHPKKFGCDFISVEEIPRHPINKHLSFNRVPYYYKKIKKVSMVRHFYRPNSIFSDYAEPTKKLLGLGFDNDKQFLKNPKFIKDPKDLAKTEDVLRKFYPKLLLQFMH